MCWQNVSCSSSLFIYFWEKKNGFVYCSTLSTFQWAFPKILQKIIHNAFHHCLDFLIIFEDRRFNLSLSKGEKIQAISRLWMTAYVGGHLFTERDNSTSLFWQSVRWIVIFLLDKWKLWPDGGAKGKVQVDELYQIWPVVFKMRLEIKKCLKTFHWRKLWYDQKFHNSY